MKTQYDLIAKEYIPTGENPVNLWVIRPNFDRLLGDVRGKTVLDLACGTGRFTRRVKLAGAQKVLGLDNSDEMLRLAREEEKKSPLGIDYVVEDALKFCSLESFDLVTFVFLFNYFSKRTELEELCSNIYKNLRSGLGTLTQDDCKARQRLYFKSYRATHGNYATNKESILKYQKSQKGIDATNRKKLKRKEKELNIIMSDFLPDAI